MEIKDKLVTLEVAKKVSDIVVETKDTLAGVEKRVDWLDISNDIRAGNRSNLDIGDEITDVWRDTAAGVDYDYIWRVNHFETCEIEGGRQVSGAWLQAKYAHPFGIQFSHQRAFLRCPSGLAAGTYYFTFESSWGSNVSAGDVVCFTLTQDVPSGGRIAGCYGAPDQAKSNWQVYSYDADGATIIETVTPTFTASGTSLGVQKNDQRSGNLNSCQEMAYGWNRWKTSAIRQHLNSDLQKDEWWDSQDGWDIAPNELSTKDGFFGGLSEGLKSLVLPIKYTTYTNTVQDGGTADITYDRVGLISLEQMYVTPQIEGEGESHEYFVRLNGTDTKYARGSSYAYDELKVYALENKTSVQHSRFRSARRGYADNTWFVNSSGYLGTNGASVAYRFQPLIFIA